MVAMNSHHVIAQLKSALRGMVELCDETRSETDGRYPLPDEGCPDCTLGTVPDRDNTGRCRYHKAKELLGII